MKISDTPFLKQPPIFFPSTSLFIGKLWTFSVKISITLTPLLYKGGGREGREFKLCNMFLLFFYIVYPTAFLGFLISFISLCSCSTLFTETNSSQLRFDSSKSLEIKTSIIFNLVFANNNIKSCFSFFFMEIDLHFLIHAVITKNLSYRRTQNTYRNTN